MVTDHKNKPCNDVIDHMEKHTGGTYSKSGKLPLPIKIIGYLLIGSLAVMFIIGLLLSFT